MIKSKLWLTINNQELNEKYKLERSIGILYTSSIILIAKVLLFVIVIITKLSKGNDLDFLYVFLRVLSSLTHLIIVIVSWKLPLQMCYFHGPLAAIANIIVFFTPKEMLSNG